MLQLQTFINNSWSVHSQRNALPVSARHDRNKHSDVRLSSDFGPDCLEGSTPAFSRSHRHFDPMLSPSPSRINRYLMLKLLKLISAWPVYPFPKLPNFFPLQGVSTGHCAQLWPFLISSLRFLFFSREVETPESDKHHFNTHSPIEPVIPFRLDNLASPAPFSCSILTTSQLSVLLFSALLL